MVQALGFRSLGHPKTRPQIPKQKLGGPFAPAPRFSRASASLRQTGSKNLGCLLRGVGFGFRVWGLGFGVWGLGFGGFGGFGGLGFGGLGFSFRSKGALQAFGGPMGLWELGFQSSRGVLGFKVLGD